MDEKWKVIEGFEIYIVSNTGKVRSTTRTVRNNNGSFVVEGKEIKGIDNGKGYLRVSLYKNGKPQRKYIHRLVARHFVPNPEGKPCVNHMDCNSLNNHAENLEWCTHKENMEWMAEQGRNKRTEAWNINHEKGMSKLYLGVVGENIMTGEKIYFSKLNDVKKEGFDASCVCDCCNGKRKTHKGYRWKHG